FMAASANCGVTMVMELSRMSARIQALTHGGQASPPHGLTMTVMAGWICLWQQTLAGCLTGKHRTGSSITIATELLQMWRLNQVSDPCGRRSAIPGEIRTITFI